MTTKKAHALCIPLPFQSHMMAMLKLAKLLYAKNFRITFVSTEFNHKRLLQSRGPRSLDGLPGFRFETIPDGLSLTASQDVPTLCDASRVHFLVPFRELVDKLNRSENGVPPVTCIVSDALMSFPITVGEELGIPVALFFTIPSCYLMPILHYAELKEKGLLPLKDGSYLTNGFLNTIIDWIPGMRPIRLRDLSSFLHTTDPNDIMLNFTIQQIEKSAKASAIVIHTFDALEAPVLAALSPNILPNVLAIGPIHQLFNQTVPQEIQEALKSIDCNLWKQETESLQWLNSNMFSPSSVLYVNFGSLAVMTPQHLVEFAWGLANSKHPFLWVIRPDLVIGDSAILPPEFVQQTKDRSLITSWCAQEEVLNHASIGGFLTHCGWNSTMESISAGVPMICWTFFADQMTNCWYICNEWGVGMEIDRDVKRGEVEKVVREVMEGEKGKEMKKKAMEWKRKAEEAVGVHGSSSLALDKLVSQVLLSKT